jgi:TatD DNase family protein
MIFDTHCHAYWNSLEERHTEIRSLMAAENVRRSIQVGTNLETSRKALALARSWGDGTWCAAAMHPTSCQNMPADTAGAWTERLESFIRENRDKVVAVGETGLDYYHLTPGKSSVQKRSQNAFFAAHAELARKLRLPLVIHTRNAAADTLQLIRACNIRSAVIHCFSEDTEFARALCSWSDRIYFSFSGILTYRKAGPIQRAAQSLPLDRIMVETDAPFLVPEPVKGRFKVNEPACTRYIMDFLKALRPEPAEVVEQEVWVNSNRFFGLVI